MIKNFMYFTILTFVVVFVWIALTVYRNFNPPNPPTGTTVNPIVGSFDFETVERLKTRTVIPADFSETFISTPSPTIAALQRTASPSSIIEPTVIPVASPSGSETVPEVQN